MSIRNTTSVQRSFHLPTGNLFDDRESFADIPGDASLFFERLSSLPAELRAQIYSDLMPCCYHDNATLEDGAYELEALACYDLQTSLLAWRDWLRSRLDPLSETLETSINNMISDHKRTGFRRRQLWVNDMMIKGHERALHICKLSSKETHTKEMRSLRDLRKEIIQRRQELAIRAATTANAMIDNRRDQLFPYWNDGAGNRINQELINYVHCINIYTRSYLEQLATETASASDLLLLSEVQRDIDEYDPQEWVKREAAEAKRREEYVATRVIEW